MTVICVVPLLCECCFYLCSACNVTGLKTVLQLWLAGSVQSMCACMLSLAAHGQRTVAARACLSGS